MLRETKFKILFIEPFYGGSHKQLIDTLTKEFADDNDIITLPAKKWPWRARCGALKISQLISHAKEYSTLFCSSVLNLSELVGLRPDLQKLKKVMFFHENQLIYPKQQIKERDFQFGYNQITSCLVSDIIIFNSYYNMNTFLDNINNFFKLMPDYRPTQLISKIKPKCKVLYFPINFSEIHTSLKNDNDNLHIIWPHRWEFDKGPDDLFEIMFRLKDLNSSFKLSVLGETFTDVPNIFHKAKGILKDNIIHWGYIESKQEYYNILNRGHIVLSTAKHEFYGVAILEAVYCGCFPLLPDKLVYPEIYDKTCLYKNIDEAINILHDLSKNPIKVREMRNSMSIDLSKYSSEKLIPQYTELLREKKE